MRTHPLPAMPSTPRQHTCMWVRRAANSPPFLPARPLYIRRSGVLPRDQRIHWRGDSMLTDLVVGG